jgi:hypothetical protein
MPDSIDLEFYLFPAVGEDSYHLEARVTDPYGPSLIDPVLETINVRMNLLEGCRRKGDWKEYGRVLSDDIFRANQNTALQIYEDALARATKNKTTVRFRLAIAEGAQELQPLVWELLRDPNSLEAISDSTLATNPAVLFSRTITGGRSREISLRQKFQIRPLVFIANPKLLEGFGLPSVDVHEQVKVAEEALRGLYPTIIASSEQNPGLAAFKNLFAYLDDGYDVLYLVCHGRLDTADPERIDTILYFEDPSGNADLVRGSQFIEQFDRLAVPPNLVLLISCQGAGNPTASKSDADRVAASLGPRLVKAGVPAILAMQGNLLMSSSVPFVRKLLTKISDEGIIDGAVSEARQQIEKKSDSFAPVLFHRLRSGRLWYGIDSPLEREQKINWDVLRDSVRVGNGTIIIGSGLIEPYIGSQAEIAARLAIKSNYQFAEKSSQDLALVSQYIEKVAGRDALERDYLQECLRQVRRACGNGPGKLPSAAAVDSMTKELLQAEIARLIHDVWQDRIKNDRFEPYKVLARSPFKAYISTNPDALMEEALKASERIKGTNVSLPILRSGRNGPSEQTDLVKPTKDKPLLAYIYGSFNDLDQLVLAEDDYFEYLHKMEQGPNDFVTLINNIYVGSSLIFLGFRLHEWDFRILFRRLKQIRSWSKHTNFPHIAVQIDPSSAGGNPAPAKIRKYLTSFLDSSRFEIFEGSSGQFVRHLADMFP